MACLSISSKIGETLIEELTAKLKHGDGLKVRKVSVPLLSTSPSVLQNRLTSERFSPLKKTSLQQVGQLYYDVDD